MGETDELPVVNRILAEAADRDPHTAFVVHIERDLRTVILFHVADKLLRCAGQLVLLRKSAEVDKLLNELLLGRLLAELYKDSRCVTVQHRHAEALAADLRLARGNNLISLDLTVNAKRLHLALLFLTADVRDDVSEHLRPVRKVLARARDGLIGRDDGLVGLKLLPSRKRRRIALNRAVRLYRDKTSLGAEALLLRLDDRKVLRIHLRDDHRNILGPAVCGIVRDNRRLMLCVSILDCANLFFCHIDRREDKVHFTGHFLYFVHIMKDHLFIDFRHRNVQLPAIADRFFVGLTCAARARRECGHLKPGVILQYRQKALTDHARRAEYADLQFLLRCVKFLTHHSNLRARSAR